MLIHQNNTKLRTSKHQKENQIDKQIQKQIEKQSPNHPIRQIHQIHVDKKHTKTLLNKQQSTCLIQNNSLLYPTPIATFDKLQIEKQKQKEKPKEKQKESAIATAVGASRSTSQGDSVGLPDYFDFELFETNHNCEKEKQEEEKQEEEKQEEEKQEEEPGNLIENFAKCLQEVDYIAQGYKKNSTSKSKNRSLSQNQNSKKVTKPNLTNTTMCSRKYKKPSVIVPKVQTNSIEQARLEITCEPESTSFRDEGGRFNYLFVYFVLRVGLSGLPKEIAHLKSVPVVCNLEYESGEKVASKPNENALKIFSNAGMQKPKEGGASCNVVELCGSVRYKIQKLSRNHDGRKFRVKVSLKNVSEEIVKPAFTRPTLILSKRKWLKAEERAPEINARNKLEEIAEQENLKLANEAHAKKAQENYATPLRELCGMPNLEKGYPEHASLENFTGRSSVSSYDGHSVEGSDDEFIPTSAARSRKRSGLRDSNARRKKQKSVIQDSTEPPQNSPMYDRALNELAKLQSQIALYNQTLLVQADRLDRVESENAQLRRQVEFLAGSLPKRKSGTFGLSALPLPRQHSLGVVGEEDGEPMMDLGEAWNSFFQPGSANASASMLPVD